MINRPSLRTRFTLLYGAALLATLLLLAGGIYYFVQRAVTGQIDTHLAKDMASITEYVRFDPAALHKVAKHGPVEFFRVQQDRATIVASDDWREQRLDIVAGDAPHLSVPRSLNTPDGTPYRLLSQQSGTSPNVLISVAHREENSRQTLRTLGKIMLLCLPISLLLSLVLGYVIAGRVLAPISAITRKAEKISAENLSERLPVGTDDDEICRLATVFNQAVGRLEDSFGRLKRFTSDASHELRTPLAAIRSIGETALQRPEDAENCREAIGSILEETDRLRQMVDSLLMLSRADSNQIELAREPIDLRALAQEAVEFLNVLAEEKHQTIRLQADKPIIASVDHATVRQALINLLDNAIKYSPAESVITMTVGKTSGNEPYVSIADNGIGIPENDLQRIFDRFYRVDKGRSRETGGAGLGLAITKWAVECNNGRIEAHSTLHEGSEFRVIFER